MQAIWDEQPFTSIYPRDLKKRSVFFRGRVQGRVLASLKSMGLINVKQNGGIMLRNYSGGASLAAMKPRLREGWSGVMSSDNSNKRVTGLSRDDFNALPYVARGKVSFEMLEACYG